MPQNKDFHRYLEDQIKKDLNQKMVFIGGPRQVGKTTLAKNFLPSGIHNEGYLNWDIPQHREKILLNQLPNAQLWVFDEIHKYRHWRNFLKGIFDEFKCKRKILVTGSARLDYYRYRGDSLQGRYFYLRLHPLSVAELKIEKPGEDFRALLELGGFPEPFFSGSSREATRWTRDYRTRLLRDDLVPIEKIEDIGQVELLLLRLPNLVGSPLSINNIREDLKVSHRAASRWLELLERVYAIFRLTPFGSPRIRAVKKEQKHYHWDWTLVKDPSLRFENLVACHLLKWIHYLQDTHGRELDLRYFRDVDGREVDFIVTEDGKPIQAIECKWSDHSISPALKYFKQRHPKIECYQILADSEKDYVSSDGIRVCPAVLFLKNLV